MSEIIYLDNAATTKMFAEEFDLMKDGNSTLFYNPSAAYRVARKTNAVFENARAEISNELKGDSGKLYFTSSATESNNTVFQGVHLRAGDVVLISAGEHPSVHEAALKLEKKGVIVKQIPLTREGVVNENEFVKLLNSSVALVSVIHVSNETGAVNHIKKLCAYAKDVNSKILFHSDGVQAFCKVKVNLLNLGVDLYTISGHKIFAPRGIAAIWIKNNILVDPLLVGGGQEFNLRSSTENVFGALAMLNSAKIALNNFEEKSAKINQIRQNIIKKLSNSEIGCVFGVNDCEEQSPFILSIFFKGIKGEVLIHSLEDDGILVSTGSACSSKKAGNRTLDAMGRKLDEVVGSIRISFSPYDEIDEDYIVGSIIKNVSRFMKNLKK